MFGYKTGKGSQDADGPVCQQMDTSSLRNHEQLIRRASGRYDHSCAESQSPVKCRGCPDLGDPDENVGHGQIGEGPGEAAAGVLAVFHGEESSAERDKSSF
jgi:hypothetical protein